jgi:hypothetical protein
MHKLTCRQQINLRICKKVLDCSRNQETPTSINRPRDNRSDWIFLITTFYFLPITKWKSSPPTQSLIDSVDSLNKNSTLTQPLINEMTSREVNGRSTVRKKVTLNLLTTNDMDRKAYKLWQYEMIVTLMKQWSFQDDYTRLHNTLVDIQNDNYPF